MISGLTSFFSQFTEKCTILSYSKKISGTKRPLMSSIVKNMNDMNANPGTDAGPRCTSAGEPETNQHPKADGFCCKDERLLLKSMSIPFGNSILFEMDMSIQLEHSISSDFLLKKQYLFRHFNTFQSRNV